MKKFAVLLLIMFYGLSSMGMTVSLHYCCGKLKNIEWASAKEKTCGKDHEMGSKKCCDTKTFENEGNAAHDISHISTDKVKEFSSFIFSYVYTLLFIPGKAIPAYNTMPPPLTAGVPLNILHCLFRI